MAEAMSRTLNAGSEDASILYCEPCGNVRAEAFCSDCCEYLCSACANLHKKQRVSKHHTLLRGTAMPSSHPSTTTPVTVTAQFKKCPQHLDEELKFFCETHDVACCVACTVLLHNQHNQCTVVYIPEAAKDYKTGPEFLQLTGELNKTQQLAAKHVTDIEEKIKKVEQLKTEETTKLEKYRTELKQFVDKRIDQLTSQVNQLRDNDIDLLKKQLTKSKNIEDNVATMKTRIQACEQTPVELFTESKHTRHEVAQLQVDLDGIAAKTHYQVYWIHKDDQMEAVLKNKDGIATVEIALSPGCFSQLPALTVTSRGEGEINIRDIAVVSSSRLLVSVSTNQTLRLVDSVNGGSLSQVSLPSFPWGVCLMGDGKAAVLLYIMKKIQFIHVVGDTLTLDRSIDVKESPRNISAYDSSRLVISYDSPGRVEMMTIDGRVEDEVDNQKAGKQIFHNPYFIATTSSGKIFVSDYGTRMIIQMDRNLRITQTFTSPMLTSPLGIVFVSTDQLLVADRFSHSIVVLNPTSGTVTPLLGRADGIQIPRAVAWCPASKKLYVGRYGDQTTLSVFEVRNEH